MNKSTLLSLAALTLIPALLPAQPLDPASLFKPLGESWPSYAGDYSSKRYSGLKQIDQSNIKNLTLAWVAHVSGGAGGGFGGRGGGAPTIVGGEAPDTGAAGQQPANVRGSILEVNGVLYLSAPITRGPWTLATATNCGITSGGPKVARTSAIVGWECGATGSTWKLPTTT
ncbi:MAG: hypothetical protein WDO73_32020 [Ignavibacteriota bacterium]